MAAPALDGWKYALANTKIIQATPIRNTTLFGYVAVTRTPFVSYAFTQEAITVAEQSNEILQSAWRTVVPATEHSFCCMVADKWRHHAGSVNGLIQFNKYADPTQQRTGLLKC